MIDNSKLVPIAIVATFCVSCGASAEQLRPIGPELAPAQIGFLLRAKPMEVQTNPLAPGGEGVTLWECRYRVGRAIISLAVSTSPTAPMPCKRESRFGG